MPFFHFSSNAQLVALSSLIGGLLSAAVLLYSVPEYLASL